eukprot:TRINITY_DN15023_c0_g1_i1.p1 TRINITY_DN15023_c0_g1~~TRINITY_DN15023_c0_g1_i1.p1  ORF type:complete len:191 (+),score=37.56 TRINITY_DN15023_c0_g1_i1:95-667(+)
MTSPVLNIGDHELGLFKDAHGYLQSLTAEVQTIKRDIAASEEAHKEEVSKLKKEIEKERRERREGLNRFRYESESLLHKHVEQVIDNLEKVKRTERAADSSVQEDISHVIFEVDRIKDNLMMVQASWTKLAISLAQQKETVDPLNLEAKDATCTEGAGSSNQERPLTRTSATRAKDDEEAPSHSPRATSS